MADAVPEASLETIVLASSDIYIKGRYTGRDIEGRDLKDVSWLRIQVSSDEILSWGKEGRVSRGNVEDVPFYEWLWGYVAPSQVLAFKPAGSEEEIQGVPDLEIFYGVTVSADLTDGWFRYVHDGKTVFHSSIPKGTEVDPRFVVEDWTGKYIPITKEKVDGILAEAEKEARSAQNPYSRIDTANLLANKIGYDITRRISAINDAFETAEINAFQKGLAEEVDDLYRVCTDESWRLSGSHAFGSEEISALEASGMGERIERFLTFLPRVTVPLALKGKIREIVTTYRNAAYDEPIREAREQLAKDRQQLRALDEGRCRATQLLREVLEQAGYEKPQ